MRRSFLLVVVAAAGCGSGGSSSKASTGVQGTISGQSFKPTDVEAVLADEATCAVPALGSIQARAFAIRFGSYAGVCADFADPFFCTLHAASEAVTVIFADLSQSTMIPTVLAPGTYPVAPDPTAVVPQASGSLAGTGVVAFAESVLTDAACQPTPTVAKGTLRIFSVSPSATTITGHVDLTFGTFDSGTHTFTLGAGSLSGDFSAPVCSGQAISNTDLCAIAVDGLQCTSAPTCL